MEPIFFDSPAAFGAWLADNHATTPEVEVGFWKKHTGRQTMTWSEAVDEALCWGWIDSVRHSIDDDRSRLRFTPRRKGSNWSKVNLAKVEQLIARNRMQPPGIAAFEARRADRSGVYSFENEAKELPPDYVARFEATPESWAWFCAQPAGYRRAAVHWVVSAKREETRDRRFEQLLADSVARVRLAQFRR